MRTDTITTGECDALLDAHPGLKEALNARAFFRHRHEVLGDRSRYARLAREFIADARALGWRGSINRVLGLTEEVEG